ncbi:MAG: hypothetical protein IPM77_11725 [Crocinitomicaceae bacterium]|nr:hypothetical protein [Crocinitomicaceae bacterium]
MKKYAITFVTIILAFASHAHNYFVSTANMEYDDSTKQIEVSVKMTAHDFEHVLEMKYQQRLHIENIADTSEIGKYIQEYLKENFVVSCGEKTGDFNYYGKEVTLRDELFFYFSFSNITNPDAMHIKNTLLFTSFTQQQNIVHYKYGTKSKSVTLVLAKPEAELKPE